MIYFEKDNLCIRDLEPADIPQIVAGEIRQGWHATAEKYEMRLRHRTEYHAIALAAVLNGSAVGYINVYPNSPWGAFGGKGLPEIVDFGVLEECRNQGIGSALMDTAEAIAGQYADTVYLGVGMHSGYGSAQRMYVRRGYIPDGTGVWYGESVCEPYSTCANDDSLILYLSKKLR
ncbi:MAG: GNAT family N-acetyltransferase [Clostridia bacterium]|nr:GNAT family N-acetyltransferase [Clostridia bacterium]